MSDPTDPSDTTEGMTTKERVIEGDRRGRARHPTGVTGPEGGFEELHRSPRPSARARTAADVLGERPPSTSSPRRFSLSPTVSASGSGSTSKPPSGARDSGWVPCSAAKALRSPSITRSLVVMPSVVSLGSVGSDMAVPPQGPPFRFPQVPPTARPRTRPGTSARPHAPLPVDARVQQQAVDQHDEPRALAVDLVGHGLVAVRKPPQDRGGRRLRRGGSRASTRGRQALARSRARPATQRTRA